MLEKIGPTFAKLLFDAMSEGLIVVKAAVSDGKFIPPYFDYPTVSYHKKNGMPSLGTTHRDAPKNYKRLFSGTGLLSPSADFPPETFPHVDALVQYCKKNERLKSFFELRLFEDHQVSEYIIHSLVAECVDRYIQLTGSFDLNKGDFIRVTIPVYRAIINETLDVAIMAPIALTKFDFNRLKVGKRAYILKLADDLQLSRSKTHYYGSGAHASVVNAATHALVLTGWELRDNENYFDSRDRLKALSAFPTDDIDNFFAALRLATGHDTGYGQLLFYPRHWALTYYADLPILYGTTVRRYPSSFDDHGWLRRLEPVSRDNVLELGKIYRAICEADKPQLAIAIRRFNACHLRDDAEDTVIDATIGLEALLSDPDPHEMTHKLALRGAALATLYDERPYAPAKLFSGIKKVYIKRSAIVHGGRRAAKKKKSKTTELTTEDAATKAVEYLGFCIKTLLQNPRYFNPKKIDDELLLDDHDNET